MRVFLLRVVYLLIPTSNHNAEILRDYKEKLYIFWFLHQTTTKSWWPFFAWWLYIFWFLHQTTTLAVLKPSIMGCISFDSYIKPQLWASRGWTPWVVYLLIPTSNHNNASLRHSSILLYIFWFLHQTTTMRSLLPNSSGCISFDSYIKPQLLYLPLYFIKVVYLLIPTSNHNILSAMSFCVRLYIFWFLHQTTTFSIIQTSPCWLYIFWFLHQTTTCRTCLCCKSKLYIFWFLHQTTT